jgi:hypothetical protein
MVSSCGQVNTASFTSYINRQKNIFSVQNMAVLIPVRPPLHEKK